MWHLLLMWEIQDAGRAPDLRAAWERLRQRKTPRVSGWLGQCAAMLFGAIENAEDKFAGEAARMVGNDKDLAALAGTFAARNQFAAAMATAAAVADEVDRGHALRAVTEAQARAGWAAAAVQTAAGISYQLEREAALQAIAEAQAPPGRCPPPCRPSRQSPTA